MNVPTASNLENVILADNCSERMRGKLEYAQWFLFIGICNNPRQNFAAAERENFDQILHDKSLCHYCFTRL